MKLKEIKTISKFYLFLSSIVVLSGLSVLSMVGCKKTEGAVNSGSEIEFSVGGMPNTKTAYSRTDSLQLIWITGDQVSIFCDQAGGDSGKQDADYDVTPDETDPKKGTLKKAAKEDGKGLRWGDDVEHNLYAVYPSIDSSRNNVIKEIGKEGVFTFKFPKKQYCSKAGGYSPDNNTSKYMLKPNMYLAYMVAKQEGLTPTSSNVPLSFKPIATTLEITLQGKIQGDDVVISGIDVNVNSLSGNYVKESDTKDTCQIQFTAKAKANGSDFYSDVSNALTAYPSGGVTTATFNIGLSDNEGSYTLESGKSVTFTVFLPPIKNLDDVEVKCLDANGNFLGNKQILTTAKFASPASKSFFTLPKFNNLEVTIDNESITYSETAQATATMYYSDGTSELVTSSCSWSTNSSGNIVDNSGVVRAFGQPGTFTITATYTKNNVTYTATENINIGTYKTFVRSDYINWNSSQAYSKTEIDAHLAKSNVSFWDENGPAYTFSGSAFSSYNGKVYTTGRWILKMDKSAATATTLAEARTNGDYIFLPACGGFTNSGSFNVGGSRGYYWLGTRNPSNTNLAYGLSFSSGSAYVSSNSIYYYMVPMPSLDDHLVVTIDKESITYPGTAQATATMYYLDGTSEVVTSSCSWDSGTTPPIVDATGKVWAFGTGTKTITATYTKNDVTYTATKNINIVGTYKTFVRSDYINWNSSQAYSKTEIDAHLAKSYVSFWDDNGPAYTFSGSEFGTSYDGTVYTVGCWILKMDKSAATATTLAEARTNGDYIFLPACGRFNSSSSFGNGGTYGHYWLSTRYPSSTNLAYYLVFYNGFAYVHSNSTYYYMVPMPSLNDHLVVTIDNESITYPETAQATATMYYLDGTSEVVTSSCSWSTTSSSDIVDNSGVVRAFDQPGPVTITATYTKNNVTYTATKNINIGTYKTFVKSDYMTWDQAMASTTNPPAYSKSDMDTHLAKSLTVSFWDNNGPAYTFSGSDFGTSYNGVVRTTGCWILKMDESAPTATTLAEARTNGDYIFLPACGNFDSSGNFGLGGTRSNYWLSTRNPSDANYAYFLSFRSGYASVSNYTNTSNYLVPMPTLVAP